MHALQRRPLRESPDAVRKQLFFERLLRFPVHKVVERVVVQRKLLPVDPLIVRTMPNCAIKTKDNKPVVFRDSVFEVLRNDLAGPRVHRKHPLPRLALKPVVMMFTVSCY